MFTVTINGNTIEELYANVQAILNTKPGATVAPQQLELPPAQPAAQVPANPTLPAAAVPTAPMTPAPSTPAASVTPPTMTFPSEPAPAAPTVPQQPVMQPPTAAAALPPQAAPPTYTLDQLAKAGAALAQSGKMEQALALLAKYGVQTVNQLQPEQYGAFATELRALGAQL